MRGKALDFLSKTKELLQFEAGRGLGFVVHGLGMAWDLVSIAHPLGMLWLSFRTGLKMV